MDPQLKNSATLQRKGKNPLRAETAEAVEDSTGPAILLTFPHGDPSIQLTDKEVTFSAKTGPLEWKVKFTLKDMVYNGKLEL
jgi:hypothetical protein